MTRDLLLAAGAFIGSATTYDELVATLIARRRSLGITQIELDHIAGLPDGYTSKFEISVSNPRAKNARAIGRQSLPLILAALNLRLAVVQEGMLSPAEHRLLPMPSGASDRSAKNVMAERGSRGAKKANERRTEQQRRALARKAARARWAQHRVPVERARSDAI